MEDESAAEEVALDAEMSDSKGDKKVSRRAANTAKAAKGAKESVATPLPVTPIKVNVVKSATPGKFVTPRTAGVGVFFV